MAISHWTFIPPPGVSFALWINGVRLQFEVAKGREVLKWLRETIDICEKSLTALEKAKPKPVARRPVNAETIRQNIEESHEADAVRIAGKYNLTPAQLSELLEDVATAEDGEEANPKIEIPEDLEIPPGLPPPTTLEQIHKLQELQIAREAQATAASSNPKHKPAPIVRRFRARPPGPDNVTPIEPVDRDKAQSELLKSFNVPAPDGVASASTVVEHDTEPPPGPDSSAEDSSEPAGSETES